MRGVAEFSGSFGLTSANHLYWHVVLCFDNEIRSAYFMEEYELSIYALQGIIEYGRCRVSRWF